MSSKFLTDHVDRPLLGPGYRTALKLRAGVVLRQEWRFSPLFDDVSIFLLQSYRARKPMRQGVGLVELRDAVSP